MMSDHCSDIQLNTILIERTSLTVQEAVLVWQLRKAGDKQHLIAAKLGTNPGRVADVLTGKIHTEARALTSN